MDRRPAVLTALKLAVISVAIVPIWLHSFTYVRNVSVVSTQTLAYEWIRSNVPPGSRIVLERDTLRFPADLYPAVFVRRVTDESFEHYRSLGAMYLVASLDSSDDVSDAADASDRTPQGKTDATPGRRTGDHALLAIRQPARPGSANHQVAVTVPPPTRATPFQTRLSLLLLLMVVFATNPIRGDGTVPLGSAVHRFACAVEG